MFYGVKILLREGFIVQRFYCVQVNLSIPDDHFDSRHLCPRIGKTVVTDAKKINAKR